MSSQRIDVNGLVDAVTSALNEFGDVVISEMREVVDDVGKETCDEIRRNAQAYGWKNYPKTWTTTKESTTFAEKVIVHAKNGGYQIAHLLEKSHALRNGGRSKAYPHIAPAEEKAQESLFKKLRQKIGG